MAEPALATEPTMDDDGFSAEERSQFESMRDAGPGPTPEAPAVDPALSPAADPAVAPAAPPAVAAEPSGDDDGEDDDEPAAAAAPVPGAVVDPNAAKPPRRVAYGKFRRVEQRLKDAEAKLSEKDQMTARLDERLKLINEALATPAQQPQKPTDEDPEPDPETDIFGHNKWLVRQMGRQQEALQQLQEGRAAETENSQMVQAYTTDAEQFAAKEPNFVPAYQHLMQSRMVELAMYYFGKDLTAPDAQPLTGPELQRIKRTVSGEERQLATEALQQGLSPAQRVYQLARARGYRPQAPAAAPAPTNGAARTGNGAAPPAPNGKAPAAPGSLAAAPAAPSVTDEIARIKSGQDASLSLSGGGSAPQSPMTAERLANMPQEEFEAWMENTPQHIVKQLMGG